MVITYDDTDGWYDSVLGPLVTGSQTTLDSLTGTGQCGSAAIVPQDSAGQPEQGKCGVGSRLPFLVISPWSKPDFVSDQFIDQSSVVQFVEYNWRLPALGNGAADAAAGSILPMFRFGGRLDPALFLNPVTGEPRARR